MATPRPIRSLDYERELDERFAAQSTRQQSARARYQDQALASLLTQRVNTIKRVAPWVDGEQRMALASSGLDLESPQFRQIVNGLAKRKSKKSGWGALGSIVNVTGDMLGKGLSVVGKVGDVAFGEIDDIAGSIAKPVVRGALTGAQGLYEEGQGVVRNVASWDPGGVPIGGAIAGGVLAAGLAATAPVSLTGAAVAGVAAGGAALGALGGTKVEGNARWEFQSSAAIALSRRLQGRDVRLGHGWLPNVDAGEDPNNPDATFTIGEEQRQRARRVTVGGLSLTPGRLLTAGVLEPGSKPFDYVSGLVDASVALSKLDPASTVLRGAGNVNRNRRLFVEGAGGLFSARPAISGAKAQAWWTGATELRRTLAETQGEGAFYEIWKATKGRLGADVTDKLARATTEAEVDAVVQPLLGVHNALRGPMSYDTFQPLSNVRLAQEMPGPTIDLLDADQSVRQLELWLKNARAPEEMIAKHTGAMAAAHSRVGRRDAYRTALDATRDLLIDKGLDAGYARKLTRAKETADAELTKYISDSLVEGTPVAGIFLDGAATGIPKPYLYNEFINRAMPLPDARDIRRATSGFKFIFDKTLVKDGVAIADFAQGQVWKRSALLRGAYTVRVIGEEQIRMAAAGFDSLINHPLSLIAMRLGRKGGEDIEGGAFKYQNADEFAEGLDEHNRALNREFSFNGWINEKHLPFWKNFRKGDDGFDRALAGEIAQLALDPHAREAARHLDDLDGLKALFWGNGATTPGEASTGLQRFRLVMAEEAEGLMSRQVSDAYIDSLAQVVRQKTGGDADLIDAIRTGQFGGKDVRQAHGPSKELVNHINQRYDLFPDEMLAHGQKTISERGVANRLDAATRWMFSNLMAERTNNLSRSPTFRQMYGRRIEELAPFMNAEAKAQALNWAETNNLRDIATRIRKVKEVGEVGAEEADLIAKGFALDGTRDLLYDLTKRSQFFDATRLIFPFGEAWKELTTTWLKLGTQHPQVGRRAAQVIAGGRAADPDHDGQGFFYENPFGEEVFAYPGMDWVSDKLFGVKVPLTGRLAGLSLMTEVLPGVGPAVQVPAGAFLPDKPEWDWMRGVVFPFGEPDTSGGFLESFTPAWVKKFQQATGIGRNERQWNNAVMDTARYLASTGDYDTSSVDGFNDLMEDARSKAGQIYVLRGAAQFFAPTAPTPEWTVRDRNGDIQVAQLLIDDFRKMQEDDYTTAVQRFLDKYGENTWLLMQGKTAEVVPSAVSKEGADWERAHGDIVKRYPKVAGFFAPDGELDPQAFQRAIDTGKRVPLTVEQYMRLANNRVANAIYQQARRMVGGSPNQRQAAALRTLKEQLGEQYPGFGDRSGVAEAASTETLVSDLQDAVLDERLADNPLADPLRTYLDARQMASDYGAQRGLSPKSFQSSQQLQHVRAALRKLGEILSERSPEFGRVWEQVFSRELQEDDEEVMVGG